MRRHRSRRRNKQRKIIIISVCSILLFMTVGYAAMQTNLNIKAKGNVISKPTAAETITEMVTTNSNELYIDDKGNVRYYGTYSSQPNNYVTFNNELWRIIGVIDGKVKVVKNNYLPTVLTDNGITLATEICYMTICSNFMQWNVKGNNNWSDSTLKAYLNGTYYNSIEINSRNMISEETYFLGGPTLSTYKTLTSSEYYDIERSSNVYSGNTTSIVQNIGLLYVSDYGYAAGKECSNVAVREFLSDDSYLDAGAKLFMTPLSDSSDGILCHIYTLETDVANSTNGSWLKDASPNVYPTFYLKSEVEIVSGTGAQDDPFFLEM